MTHDQLHWEHLLHENGFRVTKQREQILEAVCAGSGHTSLGEIYARVQKADRSIDRSTVYRALHLFMELGVVVAADTGGEETYYEIAKTEPHHHLVCRDCGTEWEIDASAVEALVCDIRLHHHFEIETDHLVLFGRCERCRHAKHQEAFGMHQHHGT